MADALLQAAPDRQKVLEALTREGPFELAVDETAGYPIRYYKNGVPSFRALFESLRAHGDKPYLIYEDETLTYAEAYGKVAALAHHLVEAGVKKGDRVAIGMRNYPEWVLSFWAVQSIGAIMVALNAWWTGPELAFALEDSTPSALLIDGERLERLAPFLPDMSLAAVVVARRGEAGPGGEDFAMVTASPADALPEIEVLPEDLATILYTSGTTGQPKGAMATHRNHMTNLMNTLLSGAVAREMAGLQPDPNAPQAGVLQTFPFFHIGGLSGLYIGAAMGVKQALMYKWDPQEGARLIETYGISSVSAVPLVVRQLLETAKTGRNLSTLAGISSGGAPVPPDLINRIGEQFEAKAMPANGYGLTETTSAVIVNSGLDYLAHPTSVGRPVVTAVARIVSDDGADVAPGEIGELWIRGANVIPGYWKNPKATEEAFGGGWFRTGDLGRVDEDGFYYVVDRKKDVIIRGGENVYCVEVEAALLAHPRVKDATVVGLPHPEYGEEVACVIQVEPLNHNPAVSDEILASLSGAMAKFKIPSAVKLTLDDLPRTATGKVLKRDVKTLHFPERLV